MNAHETSLLDLDAVGEFTRFYDPNNCFPNPTELINWLVESRRESVLINPHHPVKRDRVQLDGLSLVAAECAHMGIPMEPGGVADLLGISPGEVEYINSAVGQNSTAVAEMVAAKVEDLGQTDFPTFEGLAWKSPHRLESENTRNQVLAALVLAANMHRGQERDSKQPFISHPVRVAGVIDVASAKLFKEMPDLRAPDNLLKQLIITALTHDAAPEDALYKKGAGSFLDYESRDPEKVGRLLVTPDIVRVTMMKHTMDYNDASSIAGDLRAITKPQGIDGSMATEPYLRSLFNHPRLMVVKSADVKHNTGLDRRPDSQMTTKREEKEVLTTRLKEELINSFIQLDSQSYAEQLVMEIEALTFGQFVSRFKLHSVFGQFGKNETFDNLMLFPNSNGAQIGTKMSA